MNKLTPNDFSVKQPVKWCPGCGNYAILTAIKKVMAEVGLEHEKYVVVSGIGCSSRFPYYVNTYGYHTIHGRALAVASGIKLSSPELFVLTITGDGDCLSIGGNHFIHAVRRNIGIKTVMFNNRIYALTKGQTSPTTLVGRKTKTSPQGNIDMPFNPSQFAVSLGSNFVARSIDNDLNLTTSVILESAKRKGFSFVEVLQRCVVFSDSEFEIFRNPQIKSDNLLVVEHGKPMIFGRNKDKAVVVENNKPKVINIDPSNPPSNLTVYNNKDINLAYIISSLTPPDFPMPLGIFLDLNRESYEDLYYEKFSGSFKFETLDEVLKDRIYKL